MSGSKSMNFDAKGVSFSPLSRSITQCAALIKGGIDPTCLAIADAPVGSDSAFSFLVIGDTDAGEGIVAEESFLAQFSQAVMAHLGENRFLLHTGDVAYPVGNYENYFERFLRPYQQLLTQLPASAFYRHDAITFNRPLLAVPGNHDYADADRSWHATLWRQFLRKMCDRLRVSLDIDLGHYGGSGGEAYAETFLDDLARLFPDQLARYLSVHYSAPTPSVANAKTLSTCLDYRPGLFTRLPNRYYRFRYGGIDFFALDSNTWNMDPATADFDQAQLDWLEKSLINSWNDPDTVGRIVYLHHSPYTTESFHWQQSETLWVRRHLRAVLERVAIS
ncbi:MAG: metallophosphoesterase, partial [Cyanobacteria bacterium J06650_10]